MDYPEERKQYQFQGSAPDRRALIKGRLLYRGSFSSGTHLRRHDAEPL